MTPLTIEHRSLGTSHVLALSGDLDVVTADDLRDILQTIPLVEGQLLVIDLARVSFCDSSGLAALVAAHNRALATRAKITLAAVPHHITRLLRTTGLDTAFPTAEATTNSQES